MLDKFIKIARENAQRVYGVKTANVLESFNIGKLSPEIQAIVEKRLMDDSLRNQMDAKASVPHSPEGIAEGLLNVRHNAPHMVSPLNDSQYLIHRVHENSPVESFHVGVPKDVYDLPDSQRLINKNVQSNTYKGLGMGALGGAALGAGLGSLLTSEEGDEGTNAVLGGGLGALGGGGLGAALGTGHGKELGRSAALGGYIANQVRSMA